MRAARVTGGRALVVAGFALAMAGIIGTAAALRQPTDLGGPSARLAFEERRLRAASPGDRITMLRERVQADDSDAQAWAALGLAYIDEARRTGDPRFYPKAEGSLQRSLDVQAGNVTALVGRSALAAALHEFEAALEWGQRAASVAPEAANVLGVVGDALIELGRYPEAMDTYQRMVDRRPDLASYSRVAYARELQGDVPGAVAALEAAQQAASNAVDDAFASFQLGELHWNAGQEVEAVEQYRRAARLDPGSVPAAAGLARAAFAEGRVDEAIAGYRAVVERLPLPQFVAELGDIFTVTGRLEEAREQYELVSVQQRLAGLNGVNTDVETALFAADHRVDLAAGLRAAEEQWQRRKTVVVADVLAWQLHANGRQEEALAMADQALRLGTRSALFHFHRAEIHQALGRADAARRDREAAFAINPNFSILHGPALRAQVAASRS